MDDDFYGAAYKGSKQVKQTGKAANSAGFGAVADNYMERAIDLNEQLIMNKSATFFFRMKGDAMQDAGISEGDVLIVDRSSKLQVVKSSRPLSRDSSAVIAPNPMLCAVSITLSTIRRT